MAHPTPWRARARTWTLASPSSPPSRTHAGACCDSHPHSPHTAAAPALTARAAAAGRACPAETPTAGAFRAASHTHIASHRLAAAVNTALRMCRQQYKFGSCNQSFILDAIMEVSEGVCALCIPALVSCGCEFLQALNRAPFPSTRTSASTGCGLGGSRIHACTHWLASRKTPNPATHVPHHPHTCTVPPPAAAAQATARSPVAAAAAAPRWRRPRCRQGSQSSRGP